MWEWGWAESECCVGIPKIIEYVMRRRKRKRFGDQEKDCGCNPANYVLASSKKAELCCSGRYIVLLFQKDLLFIHQTGRASSVLCRSASPMLFVMVPRELIHVTGEIMRQEKQHLVFPWFSPQDFSHPMTAESWSWISTSSRPG